MLRSRSRSQSCTMLRPDKSWTSVVKGSNNYSPKNKPECDVTSRMKNMHVSVHPQLEWPTYQENGQRKYGPPASWTGPPPPKGTEVFLSRLHRQVLEDELCPILSTVGTIYTFRLMMDFSGSNRGYGFVQYSTREEAVKAIKELNDYPIRPGAKMTVEESLDNCRLFIGHIPKDLTESKLKIILTKYMPGLKHVFLYMSPLNKKENRGFCFVEFEDHRSAAMGRRYLLCSGVPEWNNVDITVDWAVPETELPLSVMEKVTAIYIRNLQFTTTEEQIRQLLESLTINKSFITKIKKLKDYAFIHFANRAVAAYALRCLDGVVLDGSEILVSWAKPPSYRYNGEYYYGGSMSDAYHMDSDSSSRRESFGSVQGKTSDSCHNSILKGAPLFKNQDKLAKNKLQLEPAPRFRRDSSVGHCSPSNLSHRGGSKDEGYVTDRSTTPTTLGHHFVNVPHSYVSSTASYRALVESVFPILHGTYAFQDRSLPGAFDLDNKFNMHQFAEFEKMSNRNGTSGGGFFFCNPKVVSDVPDTETNEYQSMKDIVSQLLTKHNECAYEVLKIIAEDFDWGTVFYHSVGITSGWMVSIHVKTRRGIIKLLVALESLCKTEAEALNMAASKFLRVYILDPKMFPTTKVLFFP